MKKTNAKKKPLFDPISTQTAVLMRMREDLSVKPENLVDPRYYDYSVGVQEKNLLKKYLLPHAIPNADREAIQLFLKQNEDMQRYRRYDVCVMDTNLRRVISVAQAIVRAVLGEVFDEIAMAKCAKHSSGASVGVPRMDTSLERKFKFPISSTRNAMRYLPLLIAENPQLWESVYRWNMDSPCSMIKEVEGSKLCTVPKTSVISRVACPEPTLNMYLQKGVQAMLEARMKLWGLSSKSDQEKHRRLARESSVSLLNGTVDFSSASDRISIGMVDLLFPKEWSAILIDLRSPTTKLPSGEVIELEMMSSMGNATTFPVETLVFWSIASACYQVKLGGDTLPTLDLAQLRESTSFVSVFGDDVIMPTQAIPFYLEVCQQLGFIPNVDKSFFGREFFRESCGGDFYYGRGVRAFYMKAPPQHPRRTDNEAWLYRTINGVISKYIEYFGPIAYIYDKSLLRYLFGLLKLCTDKVKFVPEYYPDDSGVTSLSDSQRIIREYNLGRVVSRVGVDKHGSLDFCYLRFEFSRKSTHNDEIRYFTDLQLRNEDQSAETQTDVRRDKRLPRDLQMLIEKGDLRMLGQYVQSRVSKVDRPHCYGYSPSYETKLSMHTN